MTDYEYLKKRVSEYLSIVNVLNIHKFVAGGGVCPDTTKNEWLDILIYMYAKNWLYTAAEEGKLVVVVGAYRIKEFNGKPFDTMPEEEEGNILYIDFMVSTAEDKSLPSKMLVDYIKNNDIKELVYHKRNSDKKFIRRKIGANYGRQKEIISKTT